MQSLGLPGVSGGVSSSHGLHSNRPGSPSGSMTDRVVDLADLAPVGKRAIISVEKAVPSVSKVMGKGVGKPKLAGKEAFSSFVSPEASLTLSV